MADIRIKVGASLDRSTLSAFESIVGAAKRARAGISQSERQGQQESRALARQQEQAARAATRTAEREARSAAHAKASAEKEAAREIEREAKRLARERESIERNAHRAATRAAKQAADEQKRISRTLNDEQNRIAKGRADLRGRVSGAAGSLAYRGAAAAGRAAVGVVGDLARGAGVDFNLGSLASKNVDLETQAAQLSNAGYNERRGAGRVGAETLSREAFTTASKTGFSANEVIGAQGKMVAKTGDLDTARKSIGDIAMLSRATGADLEDMADAAGDVSNALDAAGVTGEEKIKQLNALMRAFAGQGKEGAVEIKNLASQMAKVTAAAGQFEGGEKSIRTFGGLTQFTRARGGAASATQAATSVMSFMGTFSKGARLDAFDKAGVNVKGAGGKLRDPVSIIMDALRATKGDSRAMGTMFADVRARSVTRPFETEFNKNYQEALKSGKKEQEALDEAVKKTRASFEDLAGATMSDTELADSFADAMNTNKVQAELFNTELQKVTKEVQGALTPALQQLAPYILASAQAFSSFLTQITGKDPVKVALDKEADKTNFGAMGTAGKALASGSITQTELDANKEAEKKLDEIAKQKAAAAKAAYETQFGGPMAAAAGMLRVGRFTPVGAAAGLGDTADELDQRRYQKVNAAQGEAADAAKHLKDLKDQNKKLSDAVQGGALKVVIVAGDVKPAAPPQTTQ